MVLNQLNLIQFKNHKEVELLLSPKLNCFIGNNGVGKTNLLDAIHYLSLTKSYFNNIDSLNIKHGEDFFVIQGKFQRKEEEEAVYCALKKGKRKQLKRNKKEYERLSDHIGLFPVVMISPSDISLILDGSEERRKFINGVISQFDKPYLEDSINYNRALAQRNKLLKDFSARQAYDEDLLRIWDDQLIELGNSIFEKRKSFISDLIEIFQEYYNFIAQKKETVDIVYQSELLHENFKELLRKNRNKDLILQYSSAGIHRDDLIFKLGDYNIKKLGSQGQQKTYLVALKLAKFDFIKSVNQLNPILLLDDVFDKFDNERVTQIIKLVAENRFGQIFLTDTNRSHIEQIVRETGIENKIFYIGENGEIKEMKS